MKHVIIFVLLVTMIGGYGTHASPGNETGNASRLDFSFDEADLRLVTKLVGEITGKTFIMDDRVQGTITVVTPPRITTDQVYPFYLAILESRGYSVLRRGPVYYVVPLPERETPGAPVYSVDDLLPEDGLVTRIIKLNHIGAADIRRSLESMVHGGKTGSISVFASTNHLIITDTADNIRRLESIINELDQPGSARMVEVVKLDHASPDDLARQLTAAMEGATPAGERLTREMRQITDGGAQLPSGVTVVPADHANSLLLVGTSIHIREMKEIITALDVETPSGYGRLNAVFLNYLSAEDAAKSLNALLEKSAAREDRSAISVEPSIPNNALLIDANPRDFDLVRELVERLDQPPQQVMVEILIAEVGVDGRLDLGVDWATIDQPRDGRTTVIGRSRPGEEDLISDVMDGIAPQGITFGLAHGTFVDADGRVVPRIPFLLRALAEDRDVRILSNVPLWAQNNLQASVSVVQNIPVLKSTIEGAGVTRDIIQNIERMDVGIRLELTPYVNPDNEVRLQLNPIIEAIIDDGPADMPFSPTIARREVSTTVTIPDKSTVVLSGLIREDQLQVVSKVPLLGDVPLLGHLFRRTTDRTERTNLLIFVTPHIVTDIQTASEMRNMLEDRTGLGAVADEFGLRSKPDEE